MQYRKSTTLSSCDNYFVSRFPVGIKLMKNNRNGWLIIITIKKTMGQGPQSVDLLFKQGFRHVQWREKSVVVGSQR